MKKLLHERLRESVKSLDPASTWTIMGTLPLFPKQVIALADEIERNYAPVPRFEDGETVREGSETRHGTVEYISVEVSSGGWGNWVLHMKDGNCIEGTLSQRVERPAPKVLGADGLPIEVGETVWDTKSGLEIVVSRIAKDDGDNVIVCANGDICELQFSPKDITHTPPDTQERIDADALKYSEEYWDCTRTSCKDCPAKIDGEEPRQRYGVRNCSVSQRLDLLRRQRELDARKGGAK